MNAGYIWIKLPQVKYQQILVCTKIALQQVSNYYFNTGFRVYFFLFFSSLFIHRPNG
jgi:hypothetical protein